MSDGMTDNKPQWSKKRIVVIDDHQIVVEGITSCLFDTHDFEVCGSAATQVDGLRTIQNENPDAVILDLSLQNGHGLDLLKEIKFEFPILPVLVLSMHEDSLYADRAIRAGAKGYIMKNESFQRVADGLRCILNGELFVTDEIKNKLLMGLNGPNDSSQSLLQLLSDREFEVFKLVGQGYRPRTIAEKLNVSIKTVDTYFRRIRDKLKIQCMDEIIKTANSWFQS